MTDHDQLYDEFLAWAQVNGFFDTAGPAVSLAFEAESKAATPLSNRVAIMRVAELMRSHRTTATTPEPSEFANLWENNAIQFARLLDEIAATQDALDYDALCESMDLERDDIDELFERAMEAWELAKAVLT